MAKHVVATLGEIPPGGRKVAEVEGRSIGVFNLGGQFFALLNRCPHQGGPLCLGQQSGLLQARVPGEYTYTRKGEIVRCPWHGWEFDLKTGRSWFDPVRTRVRSYPVRVESREAGGGADDGAPAPVPGPYRAETYPVSVRQQYVVVEIP